jgi:hypothetical protein
MAVELSLSLGVLSVSSGYQWQLAAAGINLHARLKSDLIA